MSTRSRIGIQNADGTIRSIYCHFDGYPDHVGATLADSYADPTKIEALIALGDISSLDNEVAPPEGVPHSYGNAAKGVTVAYGRDRGETGIDAAESADEAEFQILVKQTGGEYAYLFRDGTWLASAYHGGFKPLADVLARNREPIR